MVFPALAVIFRDLFYLYFTKGISLQRTSKRSETNLNVRNPIWRGYKQISCSAVRSLLLKCFLFLGCYTALATLASEGPYLSSPRRDRVGMEQMQCRRWWNGGQRGQLASGCSSVPNLTMLQGQLTQLGVRPQHTGQHWKTVFNQQLKYWCFERGFCELLQKERKLMVFF